MPDPSTTHLPDGAPTPSAEAAAVPVTGAVPGAAPDRAGDVPRPRRSRRRVAAAVVLAAGAAALVAAAVVPVPYVVDGPGPTFNVLGASEGTPLIDITGTDPTTGEEVSVDPVPDGDEGQLRMVTVVEQGGPGSRLNLFGLIAAWMDDTTTITDYDDVYPQGVTADQVQSYSAAQMASSQSTAGVAALEELGWTVPATVTVAGAVPGSDAEGKVAEGDVLVSMTTPDGVVHPVESASTPFAVMRTVPAGSHVVVTVRRDGVEQDVDIVSQADSSASGAEGSAQTGSKMGVYLTADVEMPVDVAIHLERVGGPSAGMMFALGIIDRLTPGDMTGGAVIAGTGALSYDGVVEPIGGIRQKMWGAQRDGAQWFLAPADNCSEVVGNVPDGLHVVRVGTLDEARDAVEAIAAGSGDSLATCEAG